MGLYRQVDQQEECPVGMKKKHHGGKKKGSMSCPGLFGVQVRSLWMGSPSREREDLLFWMGSPSTVSTQDHPSYGTEGSIRKRTGMSIRDTPSIYKETRRIWSTSGWPVMLQFQISMPAYCEGKCTSHLSWPDISRVVTGCLHTKGLFYPFLHGMESRVACSLKQDDLHRR